MEALNSTKHEGSPDAAIGGAEAATLQRMAVRIGELGLLMPWDVGREVIPAPSVSRIPNVVSWLRGVANVRGALIPVVDGAAAFGVARAVGMPAYLFICGQGEDALGLLIDGLPLVLAVEESCRLPERPVAPALLDNSILAAYRHDGRVWLDLELESLFRVLAGKIALV